MFDVAATAVGAEGALVGTGESEKQSDKTKLTVLNGGFSSGDSSYKFELKSGGTGVIFYSDFPPDTEEFDHEVKIENLAREIEEAIQEEIASRSERDALDASEIESIRDEAFSEKLEEVFWEQINRTLEDPFFRSFYDGGEWGEEFQTTCGTVDEFIEFLELCVLTEREILAGGEDYLVVEAETDFDLAGISECSYYTERLGELVEIACAHYKPSGFRYDYNDGCYDRYSGYSPVFGVGQCFFTRIGECSGAGENARQCSAQRKARCYGGCARGNREADGALRVLGYFMNDAIIVFSSYLKLFFGNWRKAFEYDEPVFSLRFRDFLL